MMLWWPKVQATGVLCGHDFVTAWYAATPAQGDTWLCVKPAVNELARRVGRAVFVTLESHHPSWYLFRSPPPSASRLVVVSACAPNVAYASATAANHRAYCDARGYEYVRFETSFESDRPLSWSKIKFIRRVMDERPGVWIMWADADAVFMDWQVPAHLFCVERFDWVAPAFPWIDRSIFSSTGVFFVKSCAWAKSVLDRTWPRLSEGQPPWNEEVPLGRLLNSEPTARSRWLGVAPFHFNGCPNQGTYRDGDFVAHFAAAGPSKAGAILDCCELAEQRNASRPSVHAD